jgi:hypothetical protein
LTSISFVVLVAFWQFDLLFAFLPFEPSTSCFALLGAGRGHAAHVSCATIPEPLQAPRPLFLDYNQIMSQSIIARRVRTPTTTLYAAYSTHSHFGKTSRAHETQRRPSRRV